MMGETLQFSTGIIQGPQLDLQGQVCLKDEKLLIVPCRIEKAQKVLSEK